MPDILAYGVVAYGHPLPTLQLEQLDGETRGYLNDHLAGLHKKGASSPPAFFADSQASNRFKSLHNGASSSFLTSARTLAARLLAEMDGRTPEGLFVAVRMANADATSVVGVFKLQVVAARAGYLRKQRGRVTLATVKDALDAPGQLQKGAFYPDDRVDSDVIVGDRLDVGALYFLRALGLTQQQSPKVALAVMMSSIERHVPGSGRAVAESISLHRPTTVNEALDHLVRDVPNLAPVRDSLAAELDAQVRPPVVIAPAAVDRLESVILGQGITISGPVEVMRQRVSPPRLRPDGQWEVTVTFPTRPRDQIRT